MTKVTQGMWGKGGGGGRKGAGDYQRPNSKRDLLPKTLPHASQSRPVKVILEDNDNKWCLMVFFRSCDEGPLNKI